MNNKQNNNNLNKNNQNQNNNKKDEQQSYSFFNSYTSYIIAFFVIQFLAGILRQDNSPQLINLFNNSTYYDINFYLSNTNEIRYIKKSDLIYTIKNKKYCYKTEDVKNQSEYNILINKTHNISNILKLKNKKKAELYLIAEIKLKNNNLYRGLNRDYGVNPSTFISSINILKYEEDITNLLFQNQDDDIPINNEINLTKFNSNSSIPNLYYRSTFMLYFAKENANESLTLFQELNSLKEKVFVNFDRMVFFPVMTLTDFWSMDSELNPINKTELFEFKFNLNYGFLNSFLYKNMIGIIINEKYMYQNFKLNGTKDLLVELIKNNTVTYLIILFTVNILHSIFSFLGFQSDISYYKNLKNLDGVYTKYIFFNIFSMFISFVYIYIKGSNWLVKIELFISFAIEFWKLRKIFFININKVFPYVHFSYKINFNIQEAKDYESEAVSLMVKCLLIPVGIIYLFYRIYYYKVGNIIIFLIEYLFFLQSVFGFILMTPQIYINYKLKSVEHLPKKAMTYKFLNTIIDDLYAFAVKTPTMYRIFCFKDDVIFVIYIYQIWKYWGNDREEQEKIINEQDKKKEELKKEAQEKKNN
jgi:hypothetical protein